MSRAKTILLIVGICTAVVGLMALPFPVTSPKVFTQSLFSAVSSTGAFARPGLVLIAIGLVCLGLAAMVPSDRE
ncbi:conserved hypothetical protein [Anaeromyxobacter sp. K]|uniref:hypothetical protein n=1 Tax=Anaeromyxobacter sp. (strain K) TaxID=447217 RepID=UPI00015F920C|nr:hypothetical protein [Anaeromyxobacter sp. K]ACG72799.1 conserved hypothetical protein [Anaeromyxobacter sp. K]